MNRTQLFMTRHHLVLERGGGARKPEGEKYGTGMWDRTNMEQGNSDIRG